MAMVLATPTSFQLMMVDNNNIEKMCLRGTRTPTNQTESRNHLSLGRGRQGELAAETSRPRSPSEIQVIDLNSTRASLTENERIASTLTTLHSPVNPNLLQDLISQTNHCQTQNGTMLQDGCDQMPSASSSQSF